MKSLTESEMSRILLAHGTAELEFDADTTMATVVPEPHYEIAFLGLAVDGWDAVYEMYRRLLARNRNRNMQIKERTQTSAENALISEAHISFDNSTGERVTGQYLVLVEFDPALKKIIGERIYTDPVFGRMWAENLGEDFADLPGVSSISATAPMIEEHDAYAMAAARGREVTP